MFESYVIRVYRRDENGQTIGRLISASDGEETSFQNSEELLEKLGMNKSNLTNDIVVDIKGGEKSE